MVNDWDDLHEDIDTTTAEGYMDRARYEELKDKKTALSEQEIAELHYLRDVYER